jgi:hypothetical protein
MPLQNPYSLATNLVASNNLHPSTKTRFKLFINNIQSLISYLYQDQDGNNIQDNDTISYLTSIGSSWGKLPFEVDFDPPSLSIESRSVRRNGVSKKYGGDASFEGGQLSVNNFTDLHSYRFFYLWGLACAGLSRDISQKENYGNKTFISRVPLGIYKVDMNVQQYVGHEMEIEAEWHLFGVWPHVVSVDPYDNSDDGNLHTAKVDFSIDFAIPQCS